MSAHQMVKPRPESVGGPAIVRPRSWSLYAQVVVVNTVILVGATALLVLTPATVSFPVAAEQGLLLGGAVVIIGLANAVLLRVSFHELSGLVRKMETLDVLRTREPLPVRGGVETRALITGYNRMLDGLESERRTSTRRSVSVLEGERQRIGQELHDEIGQRLTGVLLQLASIRDEVPGPTRRRVQRIQAEVRATLEEVGTLAWQLRPGILDDLGLLRALEALADTAREHATASVAVNLPCRLPRITPERELAIYRVAQEALTNAIRHSRASAIQLSLACDDGRVRLEVADNGIGLADGAQEAAGIRGMRERALLIRGRFTTTTRRGRGVRVVLELDTCEAPTQR